MAIKFLNTIDTSTNATFAGNVTTGGNLLGNTSNTTELGVYSTNAIKRIRMVQGGELHFGDTTVGAPLGITEGNWNSFSDNDFLSIYGRSKIALYAGSTSAVLAATLQSTGLTLSTISNATSDTDKFLVSDSGIIKYRTGAQVLSDIGGAPATGGSYLPLTAGSTKPLIGDLYIQSKSLYVTGGNQRIYMNGGSATNYRGVEVSSSGLWSWGETGSGNYFSKKVGIGLTDPDSKLDINAGVSNVVAGPAVRISKGASPIGLIRYDTLVIEANDVATIRIGESDGTVSTIMSGDNNMRINSTDPIKFYTAGTTTGEGHAGQGGTLALTIDNSQNSAFAGTVLSSGILVGQSTQYAPTGGGTTLGTFTSNTASRTNLVISNQTNDASASAALVLATYGHDYFIKGSSSAGGSKLTLGFNTNNFLSLTSSAATFAGKATSSSTVSADAATTLVTKDYVDSSAGNPSHFRQGFKTQSVGTAFSNALTVSLAAHTGCYVTLCCFGDWGSHSTAAYRGEFFLQNGGSSYNEPGVIIRQDDNTSDGTDQIICQIVDPPGSAGNRDFVIQIRHTDNTSPTSFSGTITFTVQGKFNSVT